MNSTKHTVIRILLDTMFYATVALLVVLAVLASRDGRDYSKTQGLEKRINQLEDLATMSAQCESLKAHLAKQFAEDIVRLQRQVYDLEKAKDIQQWWISTNWISTNDCIYQMPPTPLHFGGTNDWSRMIQDDMTNALR